MKTLIAIPCMDMVPTLFMRSLLGMQLHGTVEYTFTITSLVYDARNQLADKAVKKEFDRVLWLDSDMIFDGDLFERMSQRMDEGYDIMSGLYFSRKGEFNPVVYKNCYLTMRDNCITPVNDSYVDYPAGDEPFEVAAHGFGAVMMKTSLLKEVMDSFGLPFSPEPHFGEDFSFCRRLTELGHRMYCDPSIKLGHLGYIPVTEDTFRERQVQKKCES